MDELKHAALKPSTHRTYYTKCTWWDRYLQQTGQEERQVDGAMLEGYVKFLFDNSRVQPLYFEQYMSAVFSRLGSRGIEVPECKGWRRVVLGCQ